MKKKKEKSRWLVQKSKRLQTQLRAQKIRNIIGEAIGPGKKPKLGTTNGKT